MINVKNYGYITTEDRRTILQRALYSQPYFYRMEFPLIAGANANKQFSQILGIDRDFYLTEIQGDFCQVFTDVGSLFDVTLYSGYNRSLYRFEAGRELQSGLVMTDARFRTPVVNEIFDDRQFEGMPFLIPRNDKVYAEITNTGVKASDGTANIILKGFSTLDNIFIDGDQTEQLNRSLARDVEWQYFKINVEDNGRKSYILENDREPRLILGFGAINSTTDKTLVSEVTVTITEIARRLRLTDTDIPLQFIAPRLTCLLDSHIYYLPIEYYFQPYSKLQFDINNIWLDPLDPQGVEIAVLTRTV